MATERIELRIACCLSLYFPYQFIFPVFKILTQEFGKDENTLYITPVASLMRQLNLEAFAVTAITSIALPAGNGNRGRCRPLIALAPRNGAEASGRAAHAVLHMVLGAWRRRESECEFRDVCSECIYPVLFSAGGAAAQARHAPPPTPSAVPPSASAMAMSCRVAHPLSLPFILLSASRRYDVSHAL